MSVLSCREDKWGFGTLLRQHCLIQTRLVPVQWVPEDQAAMVMVGADCSHPAYHQRLQGESPFCQLRILTVLFPAPYGHSQSRNLSNNIPQRTPLFNSRCVSMAGTGDNWSLLCEQIFSRVNLLPNLGKGEGGAILSYFQYIPLSNINIQRITKISHKTSNICASHGDKTFNLVFITWAKNSLSRSKTLEIPTHHCIAVGSGGQEIWAWSAMSNFFKGIHLWISGTIKYFKMLQM